jgi:hypothetical protein
MFVPMLTMKKQLRQFNLKIDFFQQKNDSLENEKYCREGDFGFVLFRLLFIYFKVCPGGSLEKDWIGRKKTI